MPILTRADYKIHYELEGPEGAAGVAVFKLARRRVGNVERPSCGVFETVSRAAV